MDPGTLLSRIEALGPALWDHAAALDAQPAFPTADLAALTAAGLLVAPLPASLGGCGLGTAPDAAAVTHDVFAALGRGNLSVGRVIEAHVNAVRLVSRYGSPALIERVAADAHGGALVALWVTDAPGDPLRLDDGCVTGGKRFCSASGHATRAIVTAADAAGDVRLAYVTIDDRVTANRLDGGLQGMRAASTGQMAFAEVEAQPFGAPGDYLREPDFSCGAWRTTAVTLGGLQALVAEAARQLLARGRAGDPHQLARMGQAMMARETARLWSTQAAQRAEQARDVDADAIAYVNFARLAVERACLEAMTLVQRSLGASAFLRPDPIERLCRDLGTYLRQPAGDMVLTEAAAHGMGR